MLLAEEEDEDDDEDDDDEADVVDDIIAADVGLSSCRVPVSKRTKTNGTAGLGCATDKARAGASDGGNDNG